MILHDASLHGVTVCLWHHCQPGDIVILLWLTRSPQLCPTFIVCVVSICGLGEFEVYF